MKPLPVALAPIGLLAGCSAPNEPDEVLVRPAEIIIEGYWDEPQVEFETLGRLLLITIHSGGPSCAQHLPAERSVEAGDLRVSPRYFVDVRTHPICPDRGVLLRDHVTVDPAMIGNRRMILRGITSDTRQMVEVPIPFPMSAEP